MESKWEAFQDAKGKGLLQCGHDPEAVESPEIPLWQPGGTVLLQCGHDPEAVESRDSRTSRRRTGRRFDAATTRRPWRAVRIEVAARCTGASMRPRPGGRGEIDSFNGVEALTALLQCGHDPEAVERPNQ